MPKASSHQITNLLLAWRQGEQEALMKLIPVVYSELRRRAHYYMKQERKDHPLQTTALINEAYLWLLHYREVNWKDRAHFMAVMARLMRRTLVDYARSRHYQKRRPEIKLLSLDQNRVPLIKPDPALVALDDALNALATKDERKSKVVELRFFGGLSVGETAEVLGVCIDTVMRDWRFAKTWLAREISRPVEDKP
jgi:RNA polymerase sigma-70 factor (ECF subfamily)